MSASSPRKTYADDALVQPALVTGRLFQGEWLKKASRRITSGIRVVLLSGIGLAASVAAEPFQGWPLPAAAAGGGHFSATTQITPDNVKDLEIVWMHR